MFCGIFNYNGTGIHSILNAKIHNVKVVVRTALQNQILRRNAEEKNTAEPSRMLLDR